MEIFKGWTEAFNNLFALVRDLLLFALMILLIGWPNTLNDRLVRAGVTKIHGPGFDWEANTKEAQRTSLAAATAVDQSKSENQVLSAKLDAAVAGDPGLAAQVAPIRAAIAHSDASLSVASQHLASAIVLQQTVLHSADVEVGPLSGWVYLGTIDPARTRWVGTDQTINLDWPVAEGATARIDTNAYVRAAGTGQTHSGGAFLGVAKEGSTVRIEHVELAPPLADGRIPAWAQVTVLQP